MKRKSINGHKPADIDLHEVVAERVAAFFKIRDLPFCSDFHRNYTKTIIAASIRAGKPCGCGIKSIALANNLRKMGFQVRYVTTEYTWSDTFRSLGIAIPQDIHHLSLKLTTSLHVFLKANINGAWTILDPTWDRGLIKAGFPVNSHWDGFQNTKIAVAPSTGKFNEFNQESDLVKFKNERAAKRKTDQPQRDLLQFCRFQSHFNQWLESVRGTT